MCRLELHAARAERARLIQSRDIVVKERDELIKRRAALKERQESLKKQSIEWLWFFRDALYVAERSPHPEELNEVVLRIKAIHFKLDEENRRLLEQVANYEAVESSRSGRTRQAIPDDVKLHVWTRDSGCCVKCQSPKELHFDHIIPLARGGGNQAENIQLLCRTCNLAKSDRLI
jgi:5-methylcytosine-specific restriction endonuclease McrA